MPSSVAPLPQWDHLDVNELVARWPATRPLAVIHSGGSTGPWARWSIVAPPRGHLRLSDSGASWSGPSWPRLETALAGQAPDDPIALIETALQVDPGDGGDSPPLPFPGGWLLSLSYELGGIVEPSTCPAVGPLADLLWCPDAFVHDGHAGTWWKVGAPDVLLDRDPPMGSLDLSPWESRPDRAGYEEAVRRTIELIRAGDLFQANIARQLVASCRGDLRGFACSALSRSGAWFGSWMEFPGEPARAQLGLSPELFLDLDASTGRLRTRPIKGTAAADASAGDLAASEKDAAELNMIVDLMRNDLGRVCRIGSVAVTQPRTIETHPTVHHGVAEVSGQLREDATLGDLLRGCFPPGSVTGAPKVRAMQVIQDLESDRRGPYCGAVGYASQGGDLRLGVSIRTLAFRGDIDGDFTRAEGMLRYGTGCGVVADSVPALEYEESEQKAEALRRLTTAGRPSPVLDGLT